MSRRRRKDAASISLLPILSIQKCTMGIMVVLICAQNLVSLGKTADQYLEIVGAVQDREAVYVECQQKGIIIHPGREEVPLESLKGEDPSPFHQLLDDLKASDGKQYLVLLIRPEGVAVYRECYKMALERDIQVGKDALLSGGDVVLTKDHKPVVVTKPEGR
jgi:hypothetical protein